jgi:NNP family nitrate/nitrite transporter-like MFS transporter
MSDAFGARKVMYWVLGASTVISLMLIVPKMEIYSPGKGIMAKQSGMVQEVSDTSVVVGSKVYPLVSKSDELQNIEDNVLIFPTKEVWHEPSVEVGQEVERKQLLAKGVTRIYFQANVWIFAVLVILLGSIWGVGKAAVYKYIPDYFPHEVGVVGGMVGVLGGLGGFVCPIIFGYLLEGTGLWTSCWMFMFFISAICLWWLNATVQKMMRKKHPESADQIEHTYMKKKANKLS